MTALHRLAAVALAALLTSCSSQLDSPQPLRLTTAGNTTEKPAVITDEIRLPHSSVSFNLVRLPAGHVTLLDKSGRYVTHEIKPIWIGQTEVTWDEYDIFWLALDVPENKRIETLQRSWRDQSRPSRPYGAPDRGWGHQGFPAGSMQVLCAKAYCVWLSKNTGHKYRLPTEAEWEYACRAGEGPILRLDRPALQKSAWFADNSEDQTQAVKSRQPNAWGIYDMLGNVAEWVTLMDGGTAVAGGSFRDAHDAVYPSAREKHHPSWQRSDPNEPKSLWLSDGGHVGFRIVRED